MWWGLDEGADVRVGGVHSGTVRGIVLPHKPGEKITIEMDVKNSTHDIVKEDSVASIETEGLLGNQYMAVSFGSAGQADVKDGDIIPSQPPLEMSDLLKKANGILDSSQQAIQNATGATEHLNAISAKIDQGQGTVGALVNDKQLYTNLQQSTASLQNTMNHAQEGVTDFQENMEALKHNFFLRGYYKSRGYEDSAALAKNEIGQLPQVAPMKEFTYPAKQLFDKQDSAKLKNQKSLNAVGEFLANNQFGFAVVAASTGMEGDAQKNMVLTQARAMVVLASMWSRTLNSTIVSLELWVWASRRIRLRVVAGVPFGFSSIRSEPIFPLPNKRRRRSPPIQVLICRFSRPWPQRRHLSPDTR